MQCFSSTKVTVDCSLLPPHLSALLRKMFCSRVCHLCPAQHHPCTVSPQLSPARGGL